MSSDGSSGITQFGLYRTIDARTEEFLRLSRKRQIRQGCACAAVSTAITVTVVVSVLLVYEYSLISGNSKSKSYVTKPNWLGFINASADTSPFDATHSKSQLNLDKNTIKLLPTLLKALKQNIFFEKVIEDFTSASPTDKPDDTTEQNYKKNIFSDPRNWFKAPTSRVYTIEFKASPIVYYQRTRNLEYMTKIRKIRDYKRILDYFEKMINDKVTIGSTLPMKKREFQTERPSPLSTTIPIRKLYTSKEKPPIVNFNKIVKRPIVKTKNCKCPIKLGELLNKLIGNINQLLPYTRMSESTLCKKRNSTKSIKIPAKVNKIYETPKFTTSKPVNVITTPNFIEKINTITEKETSFSMNIFKNKNFKTDSRVNHINKKQTTVRNYIEATESKNIKPHTTKPMISAIDKYTHLLYQNLQNFTQSKTTVATNKIRHKPILSNEEYDDDFINTPRTGTKYDTLDTHNLELIKTRINFPKNNAENIKIKNNVVTKNAIKSQTNTMSSSLVPIQRYKNKDFSFENKIDSIFLQKLTNMKQKIKTQNEKIMEPKAENSAEVYQFDHIHNDNQFGYEDKIIDDEFFQEYKIKQSSKTIKVGPKTESTSKPTDILKHHKKQKETQNNENLLRNVNSMLPQARPVYLEIQRNDWKQDEAHDYDFNVILLIYEYAIAVDWNWVQKRRADNYTYYGNIHDHPIADRLDRSYFGIDQDYYERMPLLVNAMQENSYLDPMLEIIPASKHNNYIHTLTTTPKNYKTNNVRRTSPRPFFFEYRSPTPLPFIKKYGSRNWVEKYRNAQRLQNIRQIIKYLEKTINAKVGDMHTKSPSTNIAFTGMYVEPMINMSETNKPQNEVDFIFQSPSNLELANSNHQSDPLFPFKPENPGEVNLLADGLLKFSPVPMASPEMSTTTLASKIITHNDNCYYSGCKEKKNNILMRSFNVFHTTEQPSTTKSFSVMLNLFPLKPISDVGDRKKIKKQQVDLNSIYFTTTRPTIHFKRKPIIPVRRTFIRRKSRILYQNKTNTLRKNNTLILDSGKKDQQTVGTNMIVHVKIYSPDIKTESSSKLDTVDTTTESFTPILIQPTPSYSTEIPFVLSTSQVEDFHVGSSGIIPIQDRTTTPPLSKLTTILPLFETTVISEDNPFTTPQDILKFSHEDAKIPQEYANLRNMNIDQNRRNFKQSNNHFEDNANTLVVKPKNVNEVTKTTTMAATTETTEAFEETTTVQTYVPQINGHYRSISQNLRNFPVTPESSRQRRLELAITDFRKPTYVPMYVEIRRNYTKKSEDDD